MCLWFNNKNKEKNAKNKNTKYNCGYNFIIFQQKKKKEFYLFKSLFLIAGDNRKLS